jgi:Tol biopolymer transport system component
VAACGAGQDLVAPTTGALTIAVATVGTSPTSGYELKIDGDAHPIGFTDTLQLLDLSAATHQVELSKTPPDCLIAESNPQFVAVIAGEDTTVTFQVVCPEQSPGGALSVLIATGGSVPDPDGYAVLVDTIPAIPVSDQDSILVPDLPAGQRTVRLAGLAAQCVVRGTNPRHVELPQAAPTRFDVTCVPSPSQMIAFSSNRPEIRFRHDLFILDGGASNLRNLTETPAINEREPVWSPDGARLAYHTFEDSNTDGVYVMDAVTHISTPLVGGLQDIEGLQWSPDGTRLLFASQTSGSVQPLTTYTFSTGQSKAVASAVRFTGFVWSPDGSEIAYSTARAVNQGDTSTISIVAAGGGLSRVVRTTTETELSIQDWSKDGTTLAYTETERDRRGDIYLLVIDGSRPPTNVTEELAFYSEARWSPDGRILAFLKRNEDETATVYASIEGLIIPIIENLGSPGHLAWAPDGEHLLFEESFQLYTVNYDGTALRALTADEFTNIDGAWRP